jgi:FkbM family methyltransferase
LARREDCAMEAGERPIGQTSMFEGSNSMGVRGVVHKFKESYRKLRSMRLLDVRKLYEEWEPMHLRRLLQEYRVDCVFDVGANYGQYAEVLRRKAKFEGLIISFEPMPAAASALREKAKGQRNWIIEEMAIADTDDYRSLNIMKSSQLSSLSEPRHDEVEIFHDSNRVKEVVSVRTENLATAYRRLKQAYQFQRPFLKLDTQGFDVEIVSSAKNVLREFIGLQSELAVKKLYANSVDFRSAITLYQECGFQLSAFVPNNAGHFPQLIETDCIMVRDDLIFAAH